MAGCATRTSFAGQPSIEAKAHDALTSSLDHLMGSGQDRVTWGATCPLCARAPDPADIQSKHHPDRATFPSTGFIGSLLDLLENDSLDARGFRLGITRLH